MGWTLPRKPTRTLFEVPQNGLPLFSVAFFRDSCCAATVEPLVSYLESTAPCQLPAACPDGHRNLGVPAAPVLLVVSYLFEHGLPPRPHHYHGKEEGHWRRAERSRQKRKDTTRGHPRKKQTTRTKT